jgi:hypothetical protein
MSTKSWQDVLLEVVEADPADFTDRKNICISPKDLGEILRAALQERDAEKVDAERYRWLRKNGNRFYNSINYQGNDEILDSGIDEAMKDKS